MWLNGYPTVSIAGRNTIASSEFKEEGKTHFLHIPGIGKNVIEALTGEDGGDVINGDCCTGREVNTVC